MIKLAGSGTASGSISQPEAWIRGSGSATLLPYLFHVPLCVGATNRRAAPGCAREWAAVPLHTRTGSSVPAAGQFSYLTFTFTYNVYREVRKMC